MNGFKTNNGELAETPHSKNEYVKAKYDYFKARAQADHSSVLLVWCPPGVEVQQVSNLYANGQLELMKICDLLITLNMLFQPPLYF